MMKKNLLLITILWLLSSACQAQLYAMRDSVANGYNFWLYVPESYKETVNTLQTDGRHAVADSVLSATKQQKLPIVVFLHGKSLCGTNLYSVRRYGSIDALAMGRQIDAVVIAPQNPGGWWKPNRVMNIVEWVRERYDVDTTRLYVLGMSLGGYGAIDFAATYPDRTAASMGLCGGSSLKDPSALSRTPIWIIHGTADKAVPVRASRRVRDAVMAVDSTLQLMRYDEWEGVDHSPLARLFYMKETYDWLFKHATTDSVRSVDREVQIPATRLKNAYVGLKRNSVRLKVVDPIGAEAAAAAAASASAPKEYYKVRPGDTLGHIAIRYNTTVKKLCSLNNITETTILQIDQKLRVK